MRVEFSYLAKQFEGCEDIIEAIRKVVQRGDFTLGKEVREFEEKFAALCGTKFAIGVNSGTDALFLSLKALGIKEGDEVITAPNSFIATIGAIIACGAKPVFVDVNDEYLIDANKIEGAIGKKTRAIIPVHLTGNPCDMPAITSIAQKHNLSVIEDACQAVSAFLNGRFVGSFGDAAAFSLHPLKNLNVWGDGGVITTSSEEICKNLLLLRNHGLADRNICQLFGYNSRLSTVQAAVALAVLKNLDGITQKRIARAIFYDKNLANIPEITIPPRAVNKSQVFHLYIVMAQKRDELLEWLLKQGVDAKIHYPIPLHLQPASRYLGYKKGDFPVCEKQAELIISLPAHQYLTEDEQEYVVDTIRKFYQNRR